MVTARTIEETRQGIASCFSEMEDEMRAVAPTTHDKEMLEANLVKAMIPVVPPLSSKPKS